MGDQRNKVFVGGVSWATDEKKFGEYFGPYGEITDCVIMRNLDTGNSRGFGFVTFADSSSVDKLLEAGEHVIDGKKLDIKIAVPRDEIGRTEATDPKNRRTCKIFAGGITLETTKADLEEYFSKYGPIVEASVMVDRVSGRPRGFGFVVFQSEESVEQLLQDKHEICGRKVDCKKAVPREEASELPKPRGPRGPPGRYDDRRSVFDPRDRRSFDDRFAGFDARREGSRGYDRFKDERFEGFPAPSSKPLSLPAFANQAAFSPFPSAHTASYAPASYSASPSGFAGGSTANPWDYASPASTAYGGAGGYAADAAYSGGQAYNAPSNGYAQPVGYGAARPAATTAPRDRYRPY